MGLHRSICAAIVAISAVIGITPASAEPAATIIILDGSGSMWGEIEGRPKLEIARETVASALSGMPADRSLGLMAYGHRTRGDCDDIELLVPPAPGTSAQILSAVRAMRFQGKTPLTEAVRRAAATLRSTEEAATVVLITDGLETCAADPCALANELEASGVDFTAHVIGFGLTRAESSKVACIADNTGGRYFEAKDAAGLADALNTAVVAAPQTTTPGLTFFDDVGFRGGSYRITADTPNFQAVPFAPGLDGSANDTARSLKAVGRWEICLDADYADCTIVDRDVADLAERGGSISSARRLDGPSRDAGPSPADAEEQENVDLYGGDYEQIVHDAPGQDWRTCAARCAGDARCRAWTHVKPGRTPFGECFLKDTVPERSADPCCVSGIKRSSAAPPPDRGSLQQPVEATFEAATGGLELSIRWSAAPAPGQEIPPEAWASEESVSGTVGERFVPGIYDVLGEAGDHVFAARVTITQEGPNRFIIPPSEADSPAGEDREGGHECVGPDPCRIDDKSGLSFLLPPGWSSDTPFLYETAGGVAASYPTVTLLGPGGTLALVLNPIRWVEDNGSCTESAVGPFCILGKPDGVALSGLAAILPSLAFANGNGR